MSAEMSSTDNGIALSNDNIKRIVARKRWKILAQVLRGGDCSDISDSSVSVRRFQTYGFLITEPLKLDGKETGNWFTYRIAEHPGLEMSIRHLTSAICAETLNGFNNTGNVCVWPSEEVMTFYCMRHVEEFKGQRICELGGGMTCLAGIALAIHSQAAHVELTDGNEESVRNLEEIIKENSFSETTVGCRVMRWGCGQLDDSTVESFDKVICADCFFFDDGRTDLSSLVFNLLKPGGQALMFAPSRNETFHKFADIASTQFTVTQTDCYDDHVWTSHLKMQKEMKDTYDTSLHFPKMMLLTKPVTSSREVTPESR